MWITSFATILLYLTTVRIIESKDALAHFIQHKRIVNVTIRTLNGDHDRHWVEYQYQFQSDLYSRSHNMALGAKKILKVGAILTRDDRFDCYNHSSKIVGYSIDLIEWLAKSLSLRLEYVKLNKPNSNWTHSLLSSDLDVLLCHPRNVKIIHPEIIELHPTLKSKYLLIYKPTKIHFTKDIFILTFAGSLWLVFLILLILLASCLRIATTKYSILHPEYELWSWVEITLWAIAAACQQGLSNTPSGFACCLIFFLGYLTAYLLYTGFAAAITSLLVQQDGYYTNIKSLDLHKVHAFCFDCTELPFRTVSKHFLSTTYVSDIDLLFKNLNNQDTIGLGPEIYINQYIRKTLHNRGETSYLKYHFDLARFDKGFYILRNNCFKNILNSGILRMEETGILQNIFNRNLEQPDIITDLKTGYSSAGYEHVGSAMLIWIFGMLIAVVILLVECAVAFYRRNRSMIGL